MATPPQEQPVDFIAMLKEVDECITSHMNRLMNHYGADKVSIKFSFRGKQITLTVEPAGDIHEQ